MSHMSPLAHLLMSILRWGSMAAGVLLALFAGIFLWQRHTPEGFVLSRQDYGFLGIVAGLFLLAVYLVRGIRKEMNRHPPA